MIQMVLIIALVLTPSFSYAQKLDGVIADTLLNEEQKVELKENLKGLINKDLTPLKNDYVDNDSRGTVEFNSTMTEKFNVATQQTEEVLVVRNYARHNVVIPDGTTIEGVNFSQEDPQTEAITGKNLTFINCNLTNVKIDPSWTLVDSINPQLRKSIEVVDGKTYQVIEKEVEPNVFEEIARDHIN